MSGQVPDGASGSPCAVDCRSKAMAKRTKNFTGVDIDPSGITAAAVSVDGRITVRTAAFAPLEPGVVRDGEVVDAEAVSETLRGLFRENKGLAKRVRIGVANQKIVVRPLELPYLSDAKELDAAVRFHAHDQLPMPIDQAVIDFQPLEVVQGPETRQQRLLLVAARRDMVANVVSAVRGAGLRPEGVDLSAFAMIRSLYRGGARDEHVLYLAVGGLTNLAVAKGTTCLFTRASGGGSEALAIELAETCQLTLDHARGWRPPRRRRRPRGRAPAAPRRPPPPPPPRRGGRRGPRPAGRREGGRGPPPPPPPPRGGPRAAPPAASPPRCATRSTSISPR